MKRTDIRIVALCPFMEIHRRETDTGRPRPAGGLLLCPPLPGTEGWGAGEMAPRNIHRRRLRKPRKKYMHLIGFVV